MENNKKAMRVSVVTVIANLVLSIFKFIAGFLGNSGAMISDAVHSSSDVLSTFIVMIGLKVSGKESDDKHRYGHERFECVVSIILAMMLGITGVGIGWGGIQNIISGEYLSLKTPTLLALIAAIVSIVVKEWMYWYTRAAAKKVQSNALMADAWHHRSDALSSVGALLGIVAARLGFPIFEPIAKIIICVLIVKTAVDIFVDSSNKLVDKSCDDETEEKMREIIMAQEGVCGIDDLRTRMFGSKIYVDVEISACGDLSLLSSHGIAECVHNKIEADFNNIKHCMVHVNPVKEEYRRQIEDELQVDC